MKNLNIILFIKEKTYVLNSLKNICKSYFALKKLTLDEGFNFFFRIDLSPLGGFKTHLSGYYFSPNKNNKTIGLDKTLGEYLKIINSFYLISKINYKLQPPEIIKDNMTDNLRLPYYTFSIDTNLRGGVKEEIYMHRNKLMVEIIY